MIGFSLTHIFHNPLCACPMPFILFSSLLIAPRSQMTPCTLPIHLRVIHCCFFGSLWVRLLWHAWILLSALMPVFQTHFKRQSWCCSSPNLNFSSKKSYSLFIWFLRSFVHKAMQTLMSIIFLSKLCPCRTERLSGPVAAFSRSCFISTDSYLK